MSDNAEALNSNDRLVYHRHVTDVLTVDEADAIEFMFDQGWTDGLPVVPPTPDRVAAMLAAASATATRCSAPCPPGARWSPPRSPPSTP